MDCETACEIYYFIQSGETRVDPEKKAEAMKHIENCPHCKMKFLEYFEEEDD